MLKLMNLAAPVISAATSLIGSAASAGILVASALSLAVAAGAVRMTLDAKIGVEVLFSVVGVASTVVGSALVVDSAVTDSAVVEEVISGARDSVEVVAVDLAVGERVVSSTGISAEAEAEAVDSTMVEEAKSSVGVSVEAVAVEVAVDSGAVVEDSIVAYGIVSNMRVSVGRMATDSTVVRRAASNADSAGTVVEVDPAQVAPSVKVPTNVTDGISTDTTSV